MEVNNYDASKLAHYILEYREKNKIYQQDLADRVGLSISTIRRLESGQKISKSAIATLADFFKKDLHEFYKEFPYVKQTLPTGAEIESKIEKLLEEKQDLVDQIQRLESHLRTYEEDDKTKTLFHMIKLLDDKGRNKIMEIIVDELFKKVGAMPAAINAKNAVNDD